MRPDGLRLRDILRSIEKIERYTYSPAEPGLDDEVIHELVLFHIQIIGEATNHLDEELVAKYPEIDWPKIVGMRNYIVHAYFKIDRSVVRDTIVADLPELKRVVTQMLQDVPGA